MKRSVLFLSVFVSALCVLPAFAGDGSVEGDPMKPQVLEAIFTVAAFVIFAGVLGFVVWPKILGALKAREGKIEGDLVGAEEARKAAEVALEEYKAKIAEVQKEATEVIEHARKNAEQVAKQIKVQAEHDAEHIKAGAKADIHAAREQAVLEVSQLASSLSLRVASKILAREVNAEDQQKLVDEALAELRP